jgi:cellulose synthase operon protein C
LKCFRKDPYKAGYEPPRYRLSLRGIPAAALAISVCAASLAGWQARAALPRWMQDAIANSEIEAALYRMMEIPGIKALYPRPPKEAQGELNGLIGKAPNQAELHSLRAMEEEQALDFTAAEKDWKAYTARSKDVIGAKFELADYYHRRLMASEEAKTLMEVGASPALPREQYTAPAEQRSWKAFERLMLLAADQDLGDEAIAKGYTAWIERYPQQPSLYAREFRWWLDESKGEHRFERASELIGQYRQTFPQDAVFPMKATALIEYRRGGTGSIEKALATYDAGFAPLWPAELVQSYYALLAQTHQLRKSLAAARERLAQNPDDLNAMARLFYYAQQQGNLEGARQVVESYRLSKESRKASWSAQELYTLAALMEAIRAYPEAARYDFALYHAQGSLNSGVSPQEEGLSGVVRILLTAPDQPIALGAQNLSMYRDIATLDHGPGYLNGILSLWLNSQSPEQEYHEEERRAQPYFHRTKAAELLTRLDKEYPKAKQRPELHKELIHALADYGESGAVLTAGNDFLTSFTSPANETNRVVVATYMADAYAREQDTKGEFALYDRMLTELSAKTAGMPLTAAQASQHGTPVTPASPEPANDEAGESANGDAATANEAATVTPAKVEKSRAFEVDAGQPAGISLDGAVEYQQILERYLGRLTAAGQLPQALAVLRKELDRNPNDSLLYERLASFLEQNNLSAQQEAVYNQAIQKFQDKGWYDKLARLYLREKKREAFASLTKQVTGIFHGTELEQYFSMVGGGEPQLYLQLNLYAHQRFPHNEVFVRNLLAAYEAKATYDSIAWEKLLREHWSDTEDLRRRFFDFLSLNGKLDAELAQLHALVPGEREQEANPDATRELAEMEMWRSHFETSAPLWRSLAEAYPANEEIGAEASSVFRSLAYYDSAQTEHAVAIEKHLLIANPADMERMATIGDIYADSGADSTKGHENIVAAAPYWRRIPQVHPGNPDGYLQAATIFWDYFQFDEALKEIHQARVKFARPSLYGYEAGAIYEGKRDLTGAIREYTAAAAESNTESVAASRLLQLARRKATAALVDEETARALDADDTVAALELRERVLETQKRRAEIGPLLEAALGKAMAFERAEEIAAQAQAHGLISIYELAMQREIALASDPVQKIELSYELERSLEGRKDIEGARRLTEQIYRENSKLLGVVRSTTDFYLRNKQPARAIEILIEAADAARIAQPTLSRQFLVEAADKANGSGDYAQARSLIGPLIDPKTAGVDAYNAQYLGVVADSYARSGDDAGLKQFYLEKLAAIRSGTATMTTDERKQKTVLLRRGLIPALTRVKDYAGAVDQYIAILSAYPEDTSTGDEAALYALRYSRQQQLIEFVGNTVKDSPRDSRFALMLAQIQTTFENYPAAIDAYARVIAIRADRADVYAAKADLEERLQRLDDACKEYERLYVLSYRNPDWMIKIAAVRARQGRKEDVVQALQRAWIEGHPAEARDSFRAATQLETWGMLEEALRFAELGVKAEGDDLLAGAEPGNRKGDDPEGAVIYTRLLTRLRHPEKALGALDAARSAADVSPNSPGIFVEQAVEQGVAAVSDAEWRKQRSEERKRTAEQRFQSAVLAMAKTAGEYFTPEEKQQFAGLVDERASRARDQSFWIDAVEAAGIRDEEARLRRQKLLDPSHAGDKSINPQFEPYVQLQHSRMDYAELAKTMEEYVAVANRNHHREAWNAQAEAYRNIGDDLSEIRTLRKIGLEQGNDSGDRNRYLQLLLKHDVSGFESFGVSSKNDEIALASPNYAATHSNWKTTRAALEARAKSYGGLWNNAYGALLGLYFRDFSPVTEAQFHSILADQRTIGERLQQSANPKTDADRLQRLTGDVWFYYGMRYGVYRTLAPEKEWAQRDPEDFLAAGVERNASVNNFVVLAKAYAEAGKTDAALAECRHALELNRDAPAIYDAMALLLWNAGKKDEAVVNWRDALATLNRIQDKGPAPEDFWSSFAAITLHLNSFHLISQLHPELETLLRNYLARNGNYRSNELLKAVFEASATKREGVDWILALSTAAADPAQVLADIDTAVWLPVEEREPILLHEIELKRIASAHAERNDYAWQQLVQLQKSLAFYYLSQKQDVKAEGVLDKLGEDERKDGEVFMARVELAARSHRLEALLAGYREDSTNDSRATNLYAMNLQLLRNAANTLGLEGDKADALTIWEFVFERLQLTHGLMTSDYMGLAEARLATGNASGAVEVLHRMTLLPGDDAANSGMTHFDEAVRLLEKTDHPREAIEFLSVLAKSVPWNSSYKVRLAKVLLKIGNDKSQAPALLSAVAADSGQSYELRVQAALAMRGSSGDAMKLGSDELRLLASGKIAAEQAQRPYFTAARITAADSLSDGAQRAELLRQAIAISPAGIAGVDGFTGDELRLKIFRVEAAVGHDAIALAAVKPLLTKTGAYSGVTADAYATESEESAANGDADNTETIDEFNRTVRPVSADTTQAALERLAPLPERRLETDAEKAALAVMIAQVYEHTEQAASALPYLRLAAYLQKDSRTHTELEQRIAVLDVAFKLEEQNALRRGKIQRGLNQNGVVRPRLTSADLTGVLARKEVQ